MTRRKLFAEVAEWNRRADGDEATATRDRLVTDQNGKTGDAFRMGKYPVRYNGCEAIALHNAKVLTGRPSSLSEAIEAMVANRAIFLRGVFGVPPYRLGRVFRAEGMPAERVRFDGLSEDGVYVLSFWNRFPPFHGLHTVAAVRKEGVLCCYNWAGKTIPDEKRLATLKKRFIRAYRIGEQAPIAGKETE